MADDNKDKPKIPPPLPGLGGKPPLPPGMGGASGKPPLPPGLPNLPGGSGKPPLPPGMTPGLPPLPGASGAKPSFPGAPGLPALPGGRMSAPPAPPTAATMPPAPPSKDDEKEKLEKKLVDMERRLAEEREKLLVSDLKRQEEAATSARVEVSLKELQDKLRRDRREQEAEENKLKLEAKLQEMENRLAQERETWVSTLKNQMAARETQDKELETHFAMRIQEMERRWLEEKANWQKLTLAKDEEIRNLRSLAEKLKGADVELQKALAEKKWNQEKLNELTQERAQILPRLERAQQIEKESIQLKADLTLAQEKLERELHSMRLSSKEREERLMGDVERLQRDLASVTERMRGEHEAELRRFKLEADGESKRYKDAVDRAASDMQKLRGIAGALERQLAAARAQLNEVAAAKQALEKTQERYKAEFVVLQRKWVEREKEIRAESQAQAMQMLEAEKAKLKVLAQDELNSRAGKIAEQYQKEKEVEVRMEVERQLAERLGQAQASWEETRKRLEGELDKLHKDLFAKEAEWTQRLLAKDQELGSRGNRVEELQSRLEREIDARKDAERARLDLDKSAQAARDEASALQALLAEAKQRLASLETEKSELSSRKEELERLATAQAAQVANAQEAMDSLRGQLARELHLAKLRDEDLGGPSAGPR